MKYYIIAGEASGDLHGANLMRALQRQDAEAQFRFWGGDAMQDVGGTPVRHIRDLAIMGFVEVATHLHTVLGNISFCKRDILEFRPDVVVTIDYPGFNLKIAKFAHQHGIKTVHYISPQLWAWKKGRIKGMRRDLDRLCYILPFEQEFYARNNFPQASYVGHPLLDAVASFRERETDSLDYGKPIVALLPGSRRQEIQRVLPIMLEVADRHAEYQFVIAGMSLIGDDFYQGFIGSRKNVAFIKDQTYKLLASSYAALVCSGTATLETALFNVPQVVGYRANAISVAIARRMIGTKIKYISLVNLIADRPIVTELIQDDMNAARLEEEFINIVDAETRKKMLEEYAYLHTLLGNAGASDRAAKEIISVC
ncbi:MAG: lipid-A-disaccharide synthase [Bacteroidales bacterium]|nr:lipid-A-disaccharide synthase [Bacteroidales bacterium]